MKFFEGCRPQFYFDGGRISKDKKNDKIIWTLKMCITLKGDEIITCDDILLHNFMAIETRENMVEEIVIAHEIVGQCIEFYSLEDHLAPVLVMMTDLTDLRMTREKDLTELHLTIETEKTDKVHKFVGDHAFTRLWAEFSDQQKSLLPPEKPKVKSISTHRGPVN